jgi:hypothetical protein
MLERALCQATPGPRPFGNHDVSPGMVEGRSNVATDPAGGFSGVVAPGQVQGSDSEVAEGGHGAGLDLVWTVDVSPRQWVSRT